MARNGKVTTAIINEQLKHLATKLDEVHADVRGLRIDSARQGAEIAGLKEDHTGLTSRVNAWSALNSIFIAVGTALGVIFGKK